jgi:hypothetical protein
MGPKSAVSATIDWAALAAKVDAITPDPFGPVGEIFRGQRFCKNFKSMSRNELGDAAQEIRGGCDVDFANLKHSVNRGTLGGIEGS